MRCSDYEFALYIKCKYNGLSRDHNHLSEFTEPELRGLHCIWMWLASNRSFRFLWITSVGRKRYLSFSFVYNICIWYDCVTNSSKWPYALAADVRGLLHIKLFLSKIDLCKFGLLRKMRGELTQMCWNRHFFCVWLLMWVTCRHTCVVPP